MWSRKPTPVARVPAPVPSRVERQRTSVSPVRRSTVAVRLMGLVILPDVHCARLHRARVPLEALRAGDRARRRRRVCARRPPHGAEPHLRHAPAEVRGREPGGEACGARGRAGCGWSPPRSRRTRCAAAAPTNRQPARRTSGASASGSAPTSCRCSGANSLAISTAARVSALCTSTHPARRPVAAPPTARRARSASRRARPPRERRPPRAGRRRARPGPAGRARPGAGRRPRRAPPSGRRARRRSRCRPRRRARAWLPARTRCRAHDHVHALHRLGAVGQRGDRLRAAHAVHTLHPQQPAGAEDQQGRPARRDRAGSTRRRRSPRRRAR